ncbi:MAG: hypothetical protein IT384_32765 [Deltaproteobacteria bacterium]|nr:hypothetical protein [Deltaproteobacteria bacterium]
MVQVEIRPSKPERLDSLDVDALVVPLYAQRAQPRGAAGLVDWRLCGRIAGLLRSERFKAAAGETVLMSGLGRLGAKRVFLFGLGAPRDRTRAELNLEVATMVKVLSEARVDDVALAPVEAPDGSPASRRALLSAYLAAPAWSTAAFSRLVLLDADGALGEDADALRAAASGLGWAAGAGSKGT